MLPFFLISIFLSLVLLRETNMDGRRKQCFVVLEIVHFPLLITNRKDSQLISYGLIHTFARITWHNIVRFFFSITYFHSSHSLLCMKVAICVTAQVAHNKLEDLEELFERAFILCFLLTCVFISW